MWTVVPWQQEMLTADAKTAKVTRAMRDYMATRCNDINMSGKALLWQNLYDNCMRPLTCVQTDVGRRRQAALHVGGDQAFSKSGLLKVLPAHSLQS